MKKIKVFFERIPGVISSFWRWVRQKTKVAVSFLDIFSEYFYPMICAFLIILIPGKINHWTDTIPMALLYLLIFYSFQKIEYYKRKLRFCQSRCPVNSSHIFFGLFNQILSMEKEINEIDVTRDVAEIEKDVWLEALSMIPEDNLELQKSFKEKIALCEKTIL